jgi:hypothetical protein
VEACTLASRVLDLGWRQCLAGSAVATELLDHVCHPFLALASCLQSIDASRQRLGLESLPLVQFYWHKYENKGYIQAVQHLGTLQVRRPPCISCQAHWP